MFLISPQPCIFYWECITSPPENTTVKWGLMGSNLTGILVCSYSTILLTLLFYHKSSCFLSRRISPFVQINPEGRPQSTWSGQSNTDNWANKHTIPEPRRLSKSPLTNMTLLINSWMSLHFDIHTINQVSARVLPLILLSTSVQGSISSWSFFDEFDLFKICMAMKIEKV